MVDEPPVAIVVGASRGIGRQVAVDLAKNGYRVIVAAKSVSKPCATVPFPPDPNSAASTISTVEREIYDAGGEATAVQVDVRNVASINSLVEKVIEIYGRIDVLVYNSGAIWWASIDDTPIKRFKLMQEVNVEGLYATIQAVLPWMYKSSSIGTATIKEPGTGKGRIIIVSPPIYSRFFRGKTAYAMGKVGMSVLTKGLAMDFERQGRKEMAVNSIWPAAAIESAATAQFTEDDSSNARDLRKATIFSDAILAMLRAPAEVVNGMLTLDEDFLRDVVGVADFSPYAVVPGAKPRRIMPKILPDLRVEEQDDEGKRTSSLKLRRSKL